MNGEMQNGGIMPRCLDVIFNTISKYQTRKYVFKPDKMNGFEVQDEADAMLACQNDILYFNQGSKSAKRRYGIPCCTYNPSNCKCRLFNDYFKIMCEL